MENAKKRVLIKAVIFVSVIVASFVCIEFLFSLIPYPYTAKLKLLKNQSSSIETIILGDSHSAHDINPDYIKNSFNFSFNGEGLDYTFMLLKKYRNELPNLKNVVISISYISFDFKTTETQFLYYYKIFFDFPATCELKSYLRLLNYDLRILPKYFYKGYYKDSRKVYYDGLKFMDINPNGYIPLSDTIELVDLASRAEKRMMHINPPTKTLRNEKLFYEFIDYCKENNLHLYLMNYPIHESLYNMMDSSYLVSMDNLCKKFDTYPNVTYCDLIQSPLFNDNDFFNLDHLNSPGAKKATLYLDSLIKMNQHQLSLNP